MKTIACLLFLTMIAVAGCRYSETPQTKTSVKTAKHQADNVDWKKVRDEVARKCRNEKGGEYDELINWVVQEVRTEYSETAEVRQWEKVQNRVRERAHREKGREYDELINWVVQEVRQTIGSGKEILPAD